MKLIFGWGLLTVVVMVSVVVLPGLEVDWSLGVFAAMASVFAILNVVLSWVLTALEVPLRVSTWGAIAVVVNTIAYLIVDPLMGSLEVDGLGPAVLGAAVVSFADLIIEGISRSFRSGIERTEQRPWR